MEKQCNMLNRVSNRKPCPLHGYIHSLMTPQEREANKTPWPPKAVKP